MIIVKINIERLIEQFAYIKFLYITSVIQSEIRPEHTDMELNLQQKNNLLTGVILAQESEPIIVDTKRFITVRSLRKSPDGKPALFCLDNQMGSKRGKR